MSKKAIISVCVAIVVLVAAVGGVVGYYKYSQYQALLKADIAEVNGQKIKVAEFIKKYNLEVAKAKLANNGEPEKAQLQTIKETALNSIINDKIIMASVKKDDVKLPDTKVIDKRVEEQYNTLMSDKTNNTKFVDILRQYGLNTDYLKKDMKTSVTLESVKETLASGLTLGDDEVKKFYESNKDRMFMDPKNPGEIDISLISFKDAKLGEEALARLKKGEKFEDMAKYYSQDAETKYKGGNIGLVQMNTTKYDRSLIMSARQLQVGNYSGLTTINDVVYIMKVNSKTEPKYKSFDEVKEQIKASPLFASSNKANAVNEKINMWISQANVKKYQDVLSRI